MVTHIRLWAQAATGATGFLAASGTLLAGPPQLQVAPWRASVVSAEPVLLRVELRNTMEEPLTVVPPYVQWPGHVLGDWPLTFEVTDGQGNAVSNAPHDAGGVTYPVPYANPWWVPHPGYESPYPPRRPWIIPPGATAFLWLDLLQFIPLHSPGRFHIVALYEARPTMLARPGSDDTVPNNVWTGRLQANAGWVTVREPLADSLAASRLLLGYAQDRHLVISAGDAVRQRSELITRFPDSPQAVYARFYDTWFRSQIASSGFVRREDLTEAIQAFQAQSPDFPLTYQFPTALAFHDWVWQADKVQRQALEGRVGAEALDRLSALAGVLRQTAEATGDYGLRGEVEDRVWRVEAALEALGEQHGPGSRPAKP